MRARAYACADVYAPVRTDSQYSAVEADSVLDGVLAHAEDELDPGLVGLGVGLTVLPHDLPLEERREGGGGWGGRDEHSTGLLN